MVAMVRLESGQCRCLRDADPKNEPIQSLGIAAC
jgi:hypothetical protein